MCRPERSLRATQHLPYKGPSPLSLPYEEQLLKKGPWHLIHDCLCAGNLAHFAISWLLHVPNYHMFWVRVMSLISTDSCRSLPLPRATLNQ